MSDEEPTRGEWNEKVVGMYKEAIDDLPALTEPSGYDKRIAYAVAMVNNGATATYAAKAVGIDVQKVYKHLKGLVTNAPNDIKREAERVITEQAVMLTVAAQEKAMEMLENDQMRPAEVIKLVQASRDTVSQRYNWRDTGREGAEKTKNALAEALQAFTAKIGTDKPEEKVIDVKAMKGEDGG